ncbi:MAG: ARMT1-like domain-containing protein [Acidobacteriota bacterium]|nr:ARMT1-like domain-containing protein [Acidobacteriota bacterium]
MPTDEITSQSLSPRCLRCMVSGYLDKAPDEVSWRTRAEYMRRVLRTVADGSETMTAPEVSHELKGILREMFGIDGDLSAEKRHFNELMLGMEHGLQARIDESDDPLDLAIRYAMVGNFIDFGPTGDVSESRLLELMGEAPAMSLDAEALADLKRRIMSARTIAYLTDNCGEVVLDKLLMREIALVNPRALVTAVVRGAPVSNDATMEDAVQVGLDRLARVLPNGSDVAGACPGRISEEARLAIGTADLVISKGLANYETLSGRGSNTYFLFLCKCELYVEAFGVPLHTGMVVRGV